MPEWVRSIANSLREFVGNRRHAPRLRARLPARVSIFEPKADPARPAPSLAGHTRDISASGVALVLPSVRIGGRYLTGPDRQLRVTLELPDGSLELRAAPVRHEQLADGDGDAADTGYLIGTHINHVADADRARLDEYLQKLKGRRD